jgi:hypothetical protein
MTEYKRQRLYQRGDNLLLLLTKWDRVFDPTDPRSHFCDATRAIVLEVLRGSVVWPKFKNLSFPRANAKAVLPYSAAWINDAHQIVDSKKFQYIFDQFNTTLWNWLYGNASNSPDLGQGRERKKLYSDISLTDDNISGLYWEFTRFLLGA